MAGVNHFKIFDETSQNLLSQADYNSHAQRLNGVGGIAYPALHNKLYRQTTVIAYALGELLAEAGYTVGDDDPAALVAAMKAVLVSGDGVQTVNGVGPDERGNVPILKIDGGVFPAN